MTLIGTKSLKSLPSSEMQSCWKLCVASYFPLAYKEMQVGCHLPPGKVWGLGGAWQSGHTRHHSGFQSVDMLGWLRRSSCGGPISFSRIVLLEVNRWVVLSVADLCITPPPPSPDHTFTSAWFLLHLPRAHLDKRAQNSR